MLTTRLKPLKRKARSPSSRVGLTSPPSRVGLKELGSDIQSNIFGFLCGEEAIRTRSTCRGLYGGPQTLVVIKHAEMNTLKLNGWAISPARKKLRVESCKYAIREGETLPFVPGLFDVLQTFSLTILPSQSNAIPIYAPLYCMEYKHLHKLDIFTQDTHWQHMQVHLNILPSTLETLSVTGLILVVSLPRSCLQVKRLNITYCRILNQQTQPACPFANFPSLYEATIRKVYPLVVSQLPDTLQNLACHDVDWQMTQPITALGLRFLLLQACENVQLHAPALLNLTRTNSTDVDVRSGPLLSTLFTDYHGQEQLCKNLFSGLLGGLTTLHIGSEAWKGFYTMNFGNFNLLCLSVYGARVAGLPPSLVTAQLLNCDIPSLGSVLAGAKQLKTLVWIPLGSREYQLPSLKCFVNANIPFVHLHCHTRNCLGIFEEEDASPLYDPELKTEFRLCKCFYKHHLLNNNSHRFLLY